jgi:hypothetical protein
VPQLCCLLPKAAAGGRSLGKGGLTHANGHSLPQANNGSKKQKEKEAGVIATRLVKFVVNFNGNINLVKIFTYEKSLDGSFKYLLNI